MQTIKTYRKVGAFYIACEADFSTSIRASSSSHAQDLVSSNPTYLELAALSITSYLSVR